MKESSDQNGSECCSNDPFCCDGGMDRRGFVRIVALGAAASFLGRGRVMAGPFDTADFEKLIPADKKLDPAWVKSLFARGERTIYRGADLKYIGMPVGGLCAGQLYLGGDGKLWHWDIFNKSTNSGAAGPHYAHPVEQTSPLEQGFAIKIGDGENARVHALDRAGFSDVSFCGEYPIGTVVYQDANAPVEVTLEAFSPFIPLNTDDSSLPATVMRFTVKNTSNTAVDATISGWLQNGVCLNSKWQQATLRNQIAKTNGMTLLHCSAEKAEAVNKPRPDVVFEDWNKENFDDSRVEGTAFGARPAKRADIPKEQGNLGGDGGNVASSYALAPGNNSGAKDSATGKLTSKPFKIERNFINFWIGGGNHKNTTCLNLLIDGKAARTAVGANKNELQLQLFDVREWAGKEATIEIVDSEKGAWGNVSVGKITFSDVPPNTGKLEETADYGTMSLALLRQPADFARASGGKSNFDAGAEDEGGPLDKPLTGALGRKLHLGAGESATVDYVVTWHFPNLALQLGKVGRYYANNFPDAPAVAKYVADNFGRLTTQTKLWRDTWYDSTLPYWFLDRTFLNNSIAATSTCYRFRDGRFYAWEGVGCCGGTCTHVWQYAHGLARTFPEVERDTRERVDLGIGMNPETGVMGFRGELGRDLAVDGQAGTILRFYREHQMTTDDAFLKRNWTKIKKSFDPLFALDADSDGVLEGAQMNTLDTPWYGKIAWLSSLYLGAMRAGEAMARAMGENDFAERCRKIAEAGTKNVVEQLFEGEYFINKVDPAQLDKINSGTGCEIDQVMGQGWAFQVGLPRVLPEKESKQALAAIWKYNFAPDVGPYRAAYKAGRWYAMAGEAGLLMCSFPRKDWDFDKAHGKGNSGFAGYFNECMNGFEYQAAGHMIWEGMLLEGLAVTRAVHDRYHASRRNPWNEIECGDHYARSMASYGIFLAACGFEYDGPRAHIGFAPRLTPEDFQAPFTTAEGWGTYSQKAEGGKLQATIDLKYGKLRLESVAVTQTKKGAVASVAVAVNGRAMTSSHAGTGDRLILKFSEPATISGGEKIEIIIS